MKSKTDKSKTDSKTKQKRKDIIYLKWTDLKINLYSLPKKDMKTHK